MSIIKELKITDEQLDKIVLEWYTERTPITFQDENGVDLEEALEQKIYNS